MTREKPVKLALNREKAIAIGVSTGVVVGAIIGQPKNVGLWISICIAIGAGIGASVGDKWSTQKDSAGKDWRNTQYHL